MSSGAVVWITGRPASGKSTFAAELTKKLAAQGIASVVLDSDELRAVLQVHDYSAEGRTAFYTILGSLAALLARQGLVALVPATAHRREYRERARQVSPRFIEVYVATPGDECASRDPKGLYERARLDAGLELPGVTVAYEVPPSPDVVAQSGLDSDASDAVTRLLIS